MTVSPLPEPAARPTVVVHADWSTRPEKRWLAVATLEGGRYLARPPEPVGDVSTLLHRLSPDANGAARVLAGFDFPIGLPAAYARRTGIRSFREWLPRSGRGEWSRFYDIAGRREEIQPRRPFYPRRPGGTSVRDLLDGLGLSSPDDLLRRCDLPQGGRRRAASVFWLVGGNQVGRAAISGWRDLLVPALRSGRAALWPFDGDLPALLAAGPAVIVETYPAALYAHLGVRFSSPRRGRPSGKRVPAERRSNAPALLRWAEVNGVDLAPGMRAEILSGFGDAPDGEDRFDATVGLLGMLDVVLGNRPPGAPDDPSVREVEGWMFGQRAADPAADPAPEPETALPQPPAEYDPLADLYDAEYTHRYDVGFWLSLAAREGGPVVEWGAGTGRLAVPLSAAGHDVTAVELSGRMVERGREKGSRVLWLQGDMRDADPGRRFGLAVCAFNSLLCLLTPADLRLFLRNAHRHLLPGGLLGIETSRFHPEELAEAARDTPLQHDLTREIPGGWLDRFSVTRYDEGTRVMRMRLFYELYTEDGVLSTRRAHDLSIRVTDREELAAMLHEAGFAVEGTYGGFGGEPLSPASDHLVVLARRT